jgi:hypothetical protein
MLLLLLDPGCKVCVCLSHEMRLEKNFFFFRPNRFVTRDISHERFPHHVAELDQERGPDQSQSSRDPKHPTKGQPTQCAFSLTSSSSSFTRNLVIFHQAHIIPPGNRIHLLLFPGVAAAAALFCVKPNQSSSWIIQRIPINLWTLLFFFFYFMYNLLFHLI